MNNLILQTKVLIEYRINQLEKALNCLSPLKKSDNDLYWEYEARQDELQTLLNQINRLKEE